MSSFVTGNLSAAKAGWLLALVFVGWLAFLLVPGPKPEPTPAPPFGKPSPSRLVALGLPDNPDLEHLPEFFALWADHAEWKDDKTIFSYWNPGSNSYTYFFEAKRANGSYHFRTIPEPNDVADEQSEFDSGLHWSEKLPEDCPFRFVYSSKATAAEYNEYNRSLDMFVSSRARELSTAPRLQVKIDAHQNVPHPPELKISPLDLEQKK